MIVAIMDVSVWPARLGRAAAGGCRYGVDSSDGAGGGTGCWLLLLGTFNVWPGYCLPKRPRQCDGETVVRIGSHRCESMSSPICNKAAIHMYLAVANLTPSFFEPACCNDRNNRSLLTPLDTLSPHAASTAIAQSIDRCPDRGCAGGGV